MSKKSLEILSKYFGYKNFRREQEAIINEIEKNRDILAIMPTGAGKSICYQIPGLLFEGLTLVISPLISLMKDQVDGLRTSGISAAYINSTLSKYEFQEVIHGIKTNKYKIIYIAPERLDSDGFLEMVNNLTVSQVAIDEAHCVSKWGHDFRVSYKRVSTFIESLKVRPVVTAFTATASTEVQKDIVKLLKLESPKIFVSGFDRENLKLSILKGSNKDKFIKDYIKKNGDLSGIIYCATRKNVEALHKDLEKLGCAVSRYHAGLSEEERTRNQEDFINDKVNVIVATNAFGMGIDKPNIRFVIHYNMPQNIEGYYQEIGRAGRDGEKSECILLFTPGDVHLQKYLIEISIEDSERQNIAYKNLKEMVGLVYTDGCYRNYILKYFGEERKINCDNCSNCLLEGEETDKTIDAQKVLSCIYRMRRKFGINILVDVLRGSKNKKITSLGFDELSTYGIMKEYKKDDLISFINTLISNGYISQEDGTFPVLSLNDKSYEIIRSKAKVIVKEVNAKKTTYETNDLFDILKKLRFSISVEDKVPPYIVFGDTTLKEMSNVCPKNKEEFLEISGVGQIKYERYGERFLDEISKYVQKK